MEPEVIEAELVLPIHLNFKRIQMYEKYPKGQSRGRHWKHLKQILQAENYNNYSPDEPNYKLLLGHEKEAPLLTDCLHLFAHFVKQKVKIFSTYSLIALMLADAGGGYFHSLKSLGCSVIFFVPALKTGPR
ncbi:uncharacterized protein LOC103485837 isoform X2 [Cucumis melo]|uniref:Uncharacterized protein LOC103485837 isoform X2 n=1 Tax=Cucumis melo TaxID=3656 RepID=A0ABM3KRV1_CUCME|nr:uncharacterized protein LOC103485837 isoform X2 [Cucumis melo]